MTSASKHLVSAVKGAPHPDVLAFFKESAALYREHLQAQTRIAQLQASTAIELDRLRSQRELLREAMHLTFAERRYTIDRMFDKIDEGLARGDRELVLQGMRSVGEIVSSSPFADIQAVANMLESKQTIEF